MAGTIIISLILIKARWDRYCYYSHFTGKQTDSEVKSLSQGYATVSDKRMQTQPVCWTADNPTSIYEVQKLSSVTQRGLDLTLPFFCITEPFKYNTERVNNGKQVTYSICLISVVMAANSYVNARHCWKPCTRTTSVSPYSNSRM